MQCARHFGLYSVWTIILWVSHFTTVCACVRETVHWIIIREMSLSKQPSPPCAHPKNGRRFKRNHYQSTCGKQVSSTKYKEGQKLRKCLYFELKETLAINWYQRMRYKHITILLWCVCMCACVSEPLSAIYPSVDSDIYEYVCTVHVRLILHVTKRLKSFRLKAY